MLNAYKSYFKNYINIDGCTSKGEFWCVFIPNTIISLLLQLAARFVSDAQSLYIVFGLVTFVPNITLGVRRLHDINKSGWWYLLYFVPVIGQLIVLVWFLKDSSNSSQNYKKNKNYSDYDRFDY